MAGELGAAQDPCERGGAVLGGDPLSVVRGDQAVDGELVEPAGGALGRSQMGGVGEQLGRVHYRRGLRRGFGRHGDRGAGRVDGAFGEDAGEDGDGIAVRRMGVAALCGVLDFGDGGDVGGVGVRGRG